MEEQKSAKNQIDENCEINSSYLSPYRLYLSCYLSSSLWRMEMLSWKVPKIILSNFIFQLRLGFISSNEK